MLVLIIVIFLLMALSDFPKLIKDKKWYEVTVLSGLYVLTFTLAALQAAGVTLPSPIKGIQGFITNVLHLAYPPY
jgi:cyanate permease